MDKLVVYLPFFPYLLALILVLLFLGRKPPIQIKKPKLGVPWAKVIYTDQKQKNTNRSTVQHQLLTSTTYGVRGKPDYIFQKHISKSLIPVELKSGTISEKKLQPYPGDLMQLGVYFLLIEDIYNKRPKEGRLIYKNYMFIIKNTRKLRKNVLYTLEEMRDMLETGEHEVDPSFIKCRGCVCRETVCEFSEVKEG